jgi:lysophosphatidate acyltransferase
MAKKSLKYIPIFGQFMQAAGAVFVDRGNNAVAVRSLQAAGEEIKRCHTSLWVFPEGTRTSRPYHDIRPFKKGAFHLAIQSGLPIVPVVAENYWNIYRQGHFNSGTFRVRGATRIPSSVSLTPLTVTSTSAPTCINRRSNGVRRW